MSIFSELKRRNVFRVGILYLVASWVLLQVGDLLAGLLGLPPWTSKLLFAALLLGFVPALIFSWVYELTPEGLKREHEVERNQSITTETARKLDVIVGVLLVVAIAMLGANLYYGRGTGLRSADLPAATSSAGDTASSAALGPAADLKSIAVLPFVDMSPAKDQEYLADGISEELLNGLVKLPGLRVAARTSAFKFKGEKVDIGEVGAKLNVAHVLEGSVRKSGDKVRITAQLIKAADGYHLWSETYDRTLDDIFAVQDDIAGEVVKALEVQLLARPAARPARPDDPEAYRLVLQGRHLIDRRSREDVERGIDYLRQSLERDPGYAPAWAELARGYATQGDNGYAPSSEAYGRAREAVGRALGLDPMLAAAHGRLSWIQASYDWDWEAASASAARALELEPGSADALRAAAAIAGTLGHFDKAVDLTRRAIEVDPLRASLHGTLGYLLRASHQEEEAERSDRKALELSPEGAGRHMNLGLSLLLQGRPEDALAEMQLETQEVWRVYGLALAYAALRRTPDADAALAELERKHGGEMAFQIAEAHAYRGETDLAFEWLVRAYAQRDPGISDIKSSRFFQPLAADPRYKAFMRKVKLPG